jgi:DNA-directed RNA polymerase specialized sigma subunit
MLFKFKWERISKADVERLTEVCSLTETERQILELRIEKKELDIIADSIGYTRRHTSRISNKLLEKILKEVYK